MTPLAAKIFRNLTDDNSKPFTGLLHNRDFFGLPKRLAQAQFFECTNIWPLAEMMRENDVAVYGAQHRFAKDINMPALYTCFEYILSDTRVLTMVRDHTLTSGVPDDFRVEVYGNKDDKPVYFGHCAFNKGNNYLQDVEVSDLYLALHKNDQNQALNSITLFACEAERFAAVINQPNLTDYVERRTDDRVLRALPRDRVAGLTTWHELKIRSGVHSTRYKKGTAEYERLFKMPLHYTRSHDRRYQTGKVVRVRGFWSGNADVGISLKTYSPQPPVSTGGSKAEKAARAVMETV